MRGMADDGAEEANVLVDDVSDMAGRAHTRGFLGAEDVHVERHRGKNYDEPPLVPERPGLRVGGVVAPLPKVTRFGPESGLGRKGSSADCCVCSCGGSFRLSLASSPSASNFIERSSSSRTIVRRRARHSRAWGTRRDGTGP
jgi:hypothetical protein